MNRTLKTIYPWSKLKLGHGFFVPSVTPTETKREGLREAVRQQVRGSATPAIFKGRFGILFVRKRW